MAATSSAPPALCSATELLNVNKHGAAKPFDCGACSRIARATCWETCVATSDHAQDADCNTARHFMHLTKVTHKLTELRV